MTDAEILQKAIEKAVENGYSDPLKLIRENFWCPNEIIFRHDFAKAFWGEDELVEDPTALRMIRKSPGQKSWRYHLQQMVLEENPIEYLEKFL